VLCRETERVVVVVVFDEREGVYLRLKGTAKMEDWGF
jgi:hypothetical protein